MLAPPNTPIADFLAKVPEPPAFLVTKNAVQSLKTLEALDQWEEVTPLGSHLLDIPLGKILLRRLLTRFYCSVFIFISPTFLCKPNVLH